MERPQPKHEIVIDDTFKAEVGDHFTKTITTYSPDAKRWNDEQAPSFGKLDEPIAYKLMRSLAEVSARMSADKGEASDAPNELNELLRQPPGVSVVELRIEKCYDPDEVVAYLINGYKDSK